VRDDSNNKFTYLFGEASVTNGLNQKSILSGSILMGTEICISVLRIASITVLARLILPEDFGLLAMVTAFTVFAERFKDFGLADSTVQAKMINHDQISALFWINIAICAGISLILAFLAKPIAWFYEEPRLVAVSIVIASTFFFSGLVIQHHALLRRQLRFGTISLIMLSSTVFSIIVAILLAYYGFGYWALVAREFSRAVFMVIGTWVAIPWLPTRPEGKVGIGKFLSFGKNITGFNMVHFFSRSLDKIVIGKLNGPSWVGIYTNAYQLISLPVGQIQYAVNAIALPALSALQNEPKEFRDYFLKMVHIVSFISMPVVVFLAVFADVIVELILSSKWKDAVPIFRLLSIGAFVEPMAHSIGPAMVALGKTKEYFKLGIINAILLLCCLIFGSFYGVAGVAIGYSSATYLAVIVTLLYGLKTTPIGLICFIRIISINCFVSFMALIVITASRYFVGWLLSAEWLVVFCMGYTLIYIYLWSFVPGGRKMLHDYLGFAKTALSMR
jgi:O-antigen/teichoic acid export membrane protein